MNKQPLYHTAEVLITSTTEIDRDRLTQLLQQLIGQEQIVDIECEFVDAEPGDPADLIG